MASTPRIVTVDPSEIISQQMEAAFNLMDRYVTQIKVPTPDDALEEVERGGVEAVIASWELGGGIKGWELAAKVKQYDARISVIILGDYEDINMDEEMLEQHTFVYLRRPFDIPQLLRVLQAALDGGDIFAASVATPASGASVSSGVPDLGPVPPINVERSDEILNMLVMDLNALAIVLATRDGQVLLEQGTMGYVNRDQLVHNLIPSMVATVQMRETLGGNASTLQYFDGDETDIYMISVGFHHFLGIVFDGRVGARQLGAVSRFGRRAAEDLIGLLGVEAWFIRPPEVQRMAEPENDNVVRKSQQRAMLQQEDEDIQLERARLADTQSIPDMSQQEMEDIPEAPKLEAIADDAFDPDLLFGDDFDLDGADDLFSLEAVEELAKSAEDGRKGLVGDEQARQLGLID